MKRKCYFIIIAAVLLIGLLSGCGNETDETNETATQESLYEETDEWEAEEMNSGDGENQEETVLDEASDNNDTTEESPAVEEVHGRIPASIQYDPDIMDYDPEDTIYYKTYYDDFVEGKIMNIDYSPIWKYGRNWRIIS